MKLTDAQVANIKKDNEELRAQMRASRENKEFSREDMKAMMDKMRAARDEIMKKNLTDEQYKAYVEFEKNNAKKKGKIFSLNKQSSNSLVLWILSFRK